MNNHHLHNNIIEKKLHQLPAVDPHHLWNEMHSILDEKMPQKKERRRFIMWFLKGQGLILLSFAILIITGFSLYFLTTNKTSAVANNKLHSAEQISNSIKTDNISALSENKENITINNESSQKIEDHKTATVLSSKDVDFVTNNDLIVNKPVRQSKKIKSREKFNQSDPAISKAMENLDNTSLNLGSIHQGPLLSVNLSEEKKYANPQLIPVTKKAIKLNPKNKNQKGLYAGIMSGVDLSSIHFKSIKAGANKGFIVGYALNKKWSIESGFFWDTKRVYDDGTYFNPPGYTPGNGITITAVNGKSRLYELPVNVKYTIIPGKHNLFATTGLSSYFMRSESYDYEYLQNGQAGGHNYLSYKNKTKDWLSVVNFSLGYTRKLGDMGSIRVEPYLKLPLKNMGVGNMPITSTGLNIGFIKKLR